MKKVKPLIESEPLQVSKYRHVDCQCGSSFICSPASEWLNPRAKTGCRFAVFKRPVKGSRRVFLSRNNGYVRWGKKRFSGSSVFWSMGLFLSRLDLTPTPQQFFVRLK